MPVSEATLSTSPEAAVARGHRLAVVEQAVQRDVHVAELAGHPGRALDDLAGLDHAAAEAGADDRGDRRAAAARSGPKCTWCAYSAAALPSLL